MPHQITLHHLNSSRSARIWWILEELGLPYEVKPYFRLPSRAAPPELKQVSPYGKAPVVTIDGETVSESGYIIHRLLALAPDCPDVETIPSNDSIFWCHASEGSLMIHFQAEAVAQGTGRAWSTGTIGGLSEEGKEAVKKYSDWLQTSYFQPQAQTSLDEMDKYLTDHPGKYFSGTDKPGQGDFMMFGPLLSLFKGSRRGSGFKVGPGLQAWFEMVSARPAFQRALDKMTETEAAGPPKPNM